MVAFLLALTQIILLVLWYVVPEFGAVSAWVIFIPAMLYGAWLLLFSLICAAMVWSRL